METQRRFIHPHNLNIMVIDVLNEKGQMVRTRNFLIKKEDPHQYCMPGWNRFYGLNRLSRDHFHY